MAELLSVYRADVMACEKDLDDAATRGDRMRMFAAEEALDRAMAKLIVAEHTALTASRSVEDVSAAPGSPE